MDTFVNRTDDVLQRRLADFVERGDGVGDVGRTAVTHSDDLGDTVRLEQHLDSGDNLIRHEVDNILTHSDEGVTTAHQADPNPHYVDDVNDVQYEDLPDEIDGRPAPYKDQGDFVEVYHGTAYPADNYINGIDINAGGGQLGVGFYAGNEEVAREFIKNSVVNRGYSRYDELLIQGLKREQIMGILVKEAKDYSQNLVVIRIPKQDFLSLKIKNLDLGNEYSVFYANWKNQGGFARNEFVDPAYRRILEPTLTDYDAIIAPVGDAEHVLQIKFNRRVEDQLNTWPRFVFDVRKR